MTEPLRIGIVGCGNIAQAHAAALRFLHEDGLVRLVAAADPDPAGIDRVAEIAGPPDRTLSDGHRLVDLDEVEAVVLLAPTRVHHEYVEHVVATRKPLFTEKPLAPSWDVARAIARLVREAALPTQVGFQSRFQPLLAHARDLVRGGEHGAPMAYLLRDDQFWPTGAVVPGHTGWRSSRAEAGGGALLEHSIHACDVLLWTFGPVRRVHAATRAAFGFDVEDVAALVIEHESGVVGTLLTVFNGVRHREERRLEVFLTGATVEVTTDFVIGAPEDSFLVHRADEEHAERLDLEALRRDAWVARGLDPDRQVFVYQYFAHRAFAEAVRDGAPPSPDVEDALAAHRLVECAYLSAARGAPVELADLDP